MYNIIKCNLIDKTCPCEYCYSIATAIPHAFVDMYIYIGEGIENPELRAYTGGYGEEWVLPEVLTWLTEEGELTGYKDGWYATRVDYDDFAKNTAGDPWIEIRAYPNAGEEMLPGVIYLQHSGLQSDGDWIVTQAVGRFNAYNVRQVGTSSGGSSGGGGSGSSLTAGEGIDITGNTISVKPATDTELGGVKQGEGVEIAEDGTLTAKTGNLTIEHAVILKEDATDYILNDYKEISYVAGQRAIWSPLGSNIICQGNVVYNFIALGFVADQTTIEDAYSNIVPLMISGGKITGINADDNTERTIEWQLCLDSITTNYKNDTIYNYYVTRSINGGAQEKITGITSTNHPAQGAFYHFSEIHAPDDTFEYGYAVIQTEMPQWAGSPSDISRYQLNYEIGLSGYNKIPFASEAEYNAAVGLLYQPQEVTG